MNYDVVIIGGGAAGLMCAAVAGQRGRRVLVVEHAERVGKKILMSGGGRCNFTNQGATHENFLSQNPHFCKSALARYTPRDFVELVERHGIRYHEKEAGQLFCDESSKQIVALLLDECAAGGVQIRINCAVSGVARVPGGYAVQTSQGEATGASLVVATGGLSIPRMGATGFGYALARQFGHTVLPTRAGLVPLTFSGTHLEHLADLAGVSLPVESRCAGQQFRGGMLVTHRGLSGPAILQISSYWQPGAPLRLNLLPDQDAATWLQDEQRRRPAAELKTVLADVLPRRLAQRVCDLRLASRPLRQYRPAQLRDIADALVGWPLTPSGTEGYRTAEVTLGGVDTRELSSTSMESGRSPGLYFVGEVVDVTGQLGGYNFQWAWGSGVAAGQAV